MEKLTQSEINNYRSSVSYNEYYDVALEDEELDIEQIEQSGICFYDINDNLVSMYKGNSIEETKNTIKKIIAVSDLGEEEITKFDKVRLIIKGFLEICFRKKVTIFLLSMLFLGMVGMGIKNNYLALVLIYLWGFLKITDTGKAVRFIKDSLEEYKLRDESLTDKEFMDFFNSAITEDVNDIKLYLIKN